jgi:hypothetical protein
VPTFLFWNVQMKPLGPMVERLAAEHGVDVVVLAEGERVHAPQKFKRVPDSGHRLRLFDRTGSVWRHRVTEQLSGWVGYRVEPVGREPYNLFAVHLPSPLHAEVWDRINTASRLKNDLLRVEGLGDERTAVVGDFNCDPFDPSLMTITGLHSVSCRGVARRGQREVRSEPYRFLYNPMWGVFGDRTPGPPGTYYRSAGQAVNYHWNVFDQVLLRPALMDGLADLRVLTTVAGESLLTASGLPDQAAASDHLPILFRLDI